MTWIVLLLIVGGIVATPFVALCCVGAQLMNATLHEATDLAEGDRPPDFAHDLDAKLIDFPRPSQLRNTGGTTDANSSATERNRRRSQSRG